MYRLCNTKYLLSTAKKIKETKNIKTNIKPVKIDLPLPDKIIGAE